MAGPIHSSPGAVVTRFGSANGSFSDKADPKVGLLAQYGPLGQSGLAIPSESCSIVGLAFDTATAVFAASQKSMGVHGVNDAPQGSSIKPQFGCGLWGESTNGLGVFGSSENNVGVFGASRNSLAGKFVGKVEITGAITASASIACTGNITTSGSLAAFDVTLSGNDCAEEFDITDAAAIEPGTVMVIDNDGSLLPSDQAYDKRVAGVISGAGNYKPGIVLDKQQSQRARVPIALVGKVYCKVDARYSRVEVGDLLTTSPTLGHAMKAEDPLKAFGAVIGKALQSLAIGRDLIPILVALQ
jgi:hypothetical protein